jgi:hypothetical protein
MLCPELASPQLRARVVNLLLPSVSGWCGWAG